MTLTELRQKEVINIKDGCRYGFIYDVEFCAEEGGIEKIIVPGPPKILGMFGRETDYCIPWECIKQIGDDIILVDCETKEIITSF